MINKIYHHETRFTKTHHPNLARIKVKGDRWCKLHCMDLHDSRMLFDDVAKEDGVVFYFRSSSDLTAFRIGFDVYDI
jgi:hypothetical protein